MTKSGHTDGLRAMLLGLSLTLSIGTLVILTGCGGTTTGASLDDLAKQIELEATTTTTTTAEPAPVATTTTTPAATSATAAAPAAAPAGMPAVPPTLSPEKTVLKLGFIKLTDCAPIIIAKEKGFFEEEGLQVDVEAQPNWKTLLDRVINGELDGAHMLSGQPIAATIGFGTKAHVVTAFTMDQNGNGITVANSVWERMRDADPALVSETPPHPIKAAALRPLIDERKSSGQLLKMAMVFPVSTHNYQLRYWLAASGIHPGFYTETDQVGETGAEVLLSVTPPPMMPTVLEAGNIQGYCVGEPWNQQAVAKGIGVPVSTNYDVWKNGPEKVFGVTKAWSDANPQTHIALVKALIRAGQWLDETDDQGNLLHREEACRILAQPNYVGADFDVIKNSMTGFFYFQKTDKRAMPEFNVFFKNQCTYPWYSDGVWFLTQMRRWGQITEAKPAEWYHETAKSIYLPDVYKKAAAMLVAQGKLDAKEVPWETDGYKAPTADFIDGITYDGKNPIGYLNAHTIGNKDEAK